MVRVCILAYFILITLKVVIALTDQNTDSCRGVPGIPGLHGAPGRDGRDGARGDRGETGKGEKGEKGDVGRIGEKGEAGAQGLVGTKGNSGKVGPRGIVGPKGIKGDTASKGSKGEPGEEAFRVNWKQCVWNRADDRDIGVIKECRFAKRSGNSALRVAFAGNLRVNCDTFSSCCSRWYFSFNGRECSGPMTIEGLVFSNRKGDNVLRHRQIEGYCENIPAGQIKVAFHVGKCVRWNTKQTHDAHTGWSSVSRIMIEETPPAQ